jgi:hypothetical protein
MDFTLNRLLRNLYLITLVLTVTALGAVYAIHNTDPHHWGFILGTTLDYIYGRELFTQVYVQYGVGLPMLFKAMNFAWSITYTNIGFLTSVVYATTLGIIFFSIERLSSTKFAVALTIIAFLFHPYAIFPWPDYYAGFFLALACYVLLPVSTTTTTGRDVLAGILFFLAFLFRNTYLVNLLVGVGAYFALSLLFPKLKDTRLTTVVATFVVLVALYLGFLSIEGKLTFWYGQNFGAVTTAYEIGKGSTELWLLRVFAPNNIRSVAVTAALWVNAYVIFLIMRRARSSDTLEPMGSGMTLFVVVLGAAGAVQGLQFYEPFRLQNACSPLYLGIACFLSWRPAGSAHEMRRPPAIWVLATLILAMGVEAPKLFNGQAHTTIWPLIEKPKDFLGKPLTGEAAKTSAYSWSQGIPVFMGHRFVPDVQSYYQSLSDVLCKSDKKIVNLTNDSMVPYVCSGPRNALYLPNYPFGLLGRISPAQLSKVERGEYGVDELVIADSTPPIAKDRRFVKIGSVARPYQLRWNRANKTVWIFAVEPRQPVNDGPQAQTLPGASEVDPKAD